MDSYFLDVVSWEHSQALYHAVSILQVEFDDINTGGHSGFGEAQAVLSFL